MNFHYLWAKTPLLRQILKKKVRQQIHHFQIQEERRAKEDKMNLRNFEKKVYSQNGEDGIIEEIFNRIGTTNKFFVEFGIENGTECNTRHLLEDKGWQGLWIDGSFDNVMVARKRFPTFSYSSY